ncbi:hypothetical protein GCM10029964_034270 [Kibdelosporangium lantanae]
MLRASLLAAARSPLARKAVEGNPLTRSVVNRFVAGARTPDAVEATRALIGSGRAVTIDYLGEDTTEIADATRTVDAYVTLLSALADQGLASGADVSVKLSAVGQALPGDGHKIALENARLIAEAAKGWVPPSPWTWRTTPPPTPLWTSCRSCGWTSRGWVR